MADFVFAYPATFAADADGRIVVRFPDLPEALTDGADLDEALAEAADALEEAIAGRILDEEDLPRPSRRGSGNSARMVVCPAPTAQKAALYLAFRNSRMTRRALARRLGLDEKEVRRMLDPRHPTKADRLDAAIAACGKTMQVTLADVSPGGRLLRAPGRRGSRRIVAARVTALTD